jgi:chemotaxis protein CheD
MNQQLYNTEKPMQDDVEIIVGMGELAVSKQPSTVLTCLGVGSCVAVCAFDPVSGVGGMAHVVLPCGEKTTATAPSKYANIAIPALLEEITKLGGDKSRLVIKVVGGARISTAPGFDGTFKIGDKNVEQVLAALEKEKLTIAAMDTGGEKGRTVRMYLATGKVIVQSVGARPKEL